MASIAQELDDIAAKDRCGICANCNSGLPFNATPNPATVREAEAFLSAQQHSIRPRKLLPSGVLLDLPRKIPDDLQMEEGRALAVWGDGAWSKSVRTGKYLDGFFKDDLCGRSGSVDSQPLETHSHANLGNCGPLASSPRVGRRLRATPCG